MEWDDDYDGDLTPDDEPVKKKKSIPQIVRRVCDYISVHNN